MAKEIDVGGLAALKGLADALAGGDDVAGAYAAVRADIAARLVGHGVPEAAAAHIAEEAVHRYLDHLAHGMSPEEAAQESRRVPVDDAALGDVSPETGDPLLQALADGTGVQAAVDGVAGGSPDPGALARAAASGRSLTGELKAMHDAAQGQQDSSAVETSAGDRLAAALAAEGGAAAKAIAEATAGMSPEHAAAFLTQLHTSLASGGTSDGALTAAHAAAAAATPPSVPLDPARQLAAALALGGTAAEQALTELINGMGAGEAGAFADRLATALAAGQPPAAAMTQAALAAEATGQALAASGVPLSDGDRLAASLAQGLVSGDALHDPSLGAVAAALAGGSSSQAALTEGTAAAAAASAQQTAAAVPADPLLAALASGENASQSLAAAAQGSDAQAFIATLSAMLVSGSSLAEARDSATRTAEAATAQATQTAVTGDPATPSIVAATQEPGQEQHAETAPPPATVNETQVGTLNPAPPPSPPPLVPALPSPTAVTSPTAVPAPSDTAPQPASVAPTTPPAVAPPPSAPSSTTPAVQTPVNHAPVAVADSGSATEAGGTDNGTAGSTATGNVLANDTDVDSGDTKTVGAVQGGTVGQATAGSYGVLTLNADGSYTYVVNDTNATVQALRSSAETLTDRFTYTVRDTAGLTGTATLTITLHGADDAPVAVADSGSATEAGGTDNGTAGSTATGNVLTNDTDVDSGDTKTVSVVEGGTVGGTLAGAYGTVTLNADGSYTYVVNDANTAVQALRTSAETLTDRFTYTVRDTAGLTGTATLTITIHGADDAPVAVADSGSATEAGGTNNGTAGSTATGNVLANDTDVDSGDIRTVWAVEGGTVGGTLAGAYGTVTLNADGSYTYVVNDTNAAVQALRTNADTLTDRFTYTVKDTAGLTSGTAVLTITLHGADDAPVAVADSGSATEAGGTGNGTAGSTATGNVLANDTDVDSGDTRTVGAVQGGTVGQATAGSYGMLTLNADGSYTYAADDTNATVQALRTSADTLTDRFTYTVRDTAGLTGTATLTITLHGADDAPVAVADSGSATEAGGTDNGTAGSTATGNVLTNDTDVDSGDTKTVSAIEGGTVGGTLAGVYGTVILNADGSYTYAVNDANAAVQALRTSADTLTDRFTYTVRDTAGLTGMATLTITLHGADDAPVAVADSGSATEAGGTNNGTAGSTATGNVLTNDTDVDSGDTRTVGAVQGGTVGQATAGSYGMLTLNADGSYTYAADDTNATVQALRTSAETLTDRFTYTVRDIAGLTGTATLTITLHGADDAPVGVADSGSATEAGGTDNGTAGRTATGNVLANDTDVDSGDTRTVWAVEGGIVGGTLAGAYGTVILNADGSYTYAVNDANAAVQALPASADTLTDRFTYTVRDTAGLTGTATLTITIHGADDAPVAVADSGSATEAGGTDNGTAGSAATGNVLANDTDVDTGASLSVTAIRTGGTEGAGTAGTLGNGLAGTYGTLTLNTDGTYTYAVDNSNATVNALAVGSTVTDRFNYTVSDGSLTDTGVLTITVNGANDAPTLTSVNTLSGAAKNTAFTITYAALMAAANEHDVDGGTLSFRVEGVSAGTLTKNGVAVTAGATLLGSGESLVWTPATDATGSQNAFTITAYDGSLSSSSAVQVQVSVADVAAGFVGGSVNATTGHYYQHYSGTQNLSWTAAEAYAESTTYKGVAGHLATVSSAAENAFIATLLGGAPAWLGGSDHAVEGTFAWVTGESFSYTNWSSGEPNNAGGNEDYLEMYVGGQWNDLGNNTAGIGYVIEYDTTINDPPLAPVAEDEANPVGETIATLYAGLDTTAGIRVIGNNATSDQGAWQYSTDHGATWTPVSAAVSDTQPLALAHDSMVRFLPAAHWNGSPGGLVTDVAGLDVFELITTTVIPANDAPAASGTAVLPGVASTGQNPSGSLVAALFAGNFSDAADTVSGAQGDALAGIAVTGDAASAQQGVWQFSTDQGRSWTAIAPGVSDHAALVLSASDRLRFVPGSGADGAPGTLAVRLIETGGSPVSSGSVVDLSASGAVGGSSRVSAQTITVAAGTPANSLPPAERGAIMVPHGTDYRGMVLGRGQPGETFHDTLNAASTGNASLLSHSEGATFSDHHHANDAAGSAGSVLADIAEAAGHTATHTVHVHIT